MVVEANDRVNVVWTFFWPMVAMLTQFGLLIVWACGAYQIFEFRITLGILFAFLALISRFYVRLESMSRMFSATETGRQQCAPAVRDSRSRAERGRTGRSGASRQNLRGEVELRGVGFRYGTRPIIENFNLKIEPGEMIGLVGASGSGKTTLVNLVCRFYDVSEGAILVDGIDIRRFSVAEYRRQIGIGAAGAVSVLRHRGREHRLWPARGHARAKSSPPPGPPGRTISSCGCRWATTRWWASAGSFCRAESGSGFRSPGRC